MPGPFTVDRPPAHMPATLFVPVENQVRELDAKLLFGLVATAAGHEVVLGRKQHLYFALPDFPPGIFIAKSMRAGSKLMFDIVRGLGQYYAWRFSPATFNAVSHLFAWGADDAAMFAAYPGNRGVGIHATGNPRLDLLREPMRDYFAPDCAELRRRYGDYILVNTNFSFVNPFVAVNALVRAREGRGRVRVSRVGRGMSPAFAAGMAAHQQAIHDHFRALLPALARRFPDRCIVLRPHPSEDHEAWRRDLAGLPGIEVRHEGNIVPWLLTARVLVHNGCTTAVEAAVAGCPAVAFQPVRSAAYDYLLPNALSHRCADGAAVLDAVDGVLHRGLGQADPALRERLFQRHLAAAQGPLASERIVSLIAQLGLEPPGSSPGTRRLAALKAGVRTRIKRFNMRRPEHWASDRYGTHVFPPIAASAVGERIERLRALLRLPGETRVDPLGEALFRLRPA
jgi:surface carbohydrate biosynthesis protein